MKKKDDIISERVIKWTGIFWCILIFGVYYLYQPSTVQWFNEKTGINLVAFTMSRIYRLWYVIEQGFSKLWFRDNICIYQFSRCRIFRI